MGKKKEKERKLTKKEQIRTEKTEKLKEKLEGEGFIARDLTIGVVKANVLAILLGGIPCLFFTALYIQGLVTERYTLTPFSGSGYFLFLVAMILGIVVHEGIHGIFWGLLNPDGFKSIEFGMIMQYLTPYCTCQSPLKKRDYIIGSVMPGVLLGILPLLLSLWNGSWYLLLFGWIMTIGAGGDAAIILKLLTFKSSCREKIYVDHPTMCGLIVFER